MHNPILTKTFVTAADVNARTIIKFKANTGQVIPAAADTDDAIGVAEEVGATGGNRVDVVLVGVAKTLAAGTIAAGSRVTANNEGHAVAWSTGKKSLGIALADATDGAIIPVLIDRN
ncbi:MAG: DUF2190 domain-containing protein [Pseudomonadota bacterium]